MMFIVDVTRVLLDTLPVTYGNKKINQGYKMIKLSDTTPSVFKMDISFHKILEWRTHNQRHFDIFSMEYSASNQLTLQTPLGHTTFSANNLLHYPQLASALRKLKTMQYEMKLNLINCLG